MRFQKNAALLTFTALIALPAFSKAKFSDRDLERLELLPQRSIAADVELVVWGSEESTKRFQRATVADFFRLSNHFESQINKFYCGPATSAIVLNALFAERSDVLRPTDPALFRGKKDFLPKDYDPVFARFTQDAFFNAANAAVKTRDEVFGKPKTGSELKDYGLQLRQLHQLLLSYQGVSSEIFVVSDVEDESLKEKIIENLKTAGDYVIVNYHRPALGQKGGGHISPLGAYDKKTDSFLILDVNPNAAPWVWVSAKDLLASMNTKDTVENRGFLLVKQR